MLITGGSSFEVKIEADSSDHEEHPHDDKPMPYSCDFCDRRFSNFTSFKLHRQKHRQNLNIDRQTVTVQRWYSCSQCGECFLSSDQFRRHMNVHRGRYKCTECGKCCQNKEYLINHMNIHTKQMNIRTGKYKCTECGKCYASGAYLAVHKSLSLIHI